MKPDYTEMESEHSIPVYNHLGIPCYLCCEEIERHRVAGRIGVIRCQHCGEDFLIMCCWDIRKHKMGFTEPVMELPKHWDYGDPPFHYLKDGNSCIGNTMLSIAEYEFETWGFPQESQKLAWLGLT